MKAITSLFVLAAVIVAQDQPTPKLPIGRETTFVTGPLTKDGYVDFGAALNEHLGRDVKPEKNANALLWSALGPTPEGGRGMPAEYFRLLGIPPPPPKGEYFVGLREFVVKRPMDDGVSFEALSDQLTHARQRVWTANDYPLIAEWIRANETPLAIAIEASRRPDYFNPLVPDVVNDEPVPFTAFRLPTLQKCRDIGAALTARATIRAGAGQFDKAWNDLLASHRLARLIGRGGTSMEGLVGLAVDAIAIFGDMAFLERASAAGRTLHDRLTELQSLPPLPPLADKIEWCERFMYLDAVQLVRKGWASKLGQGVNAEPAKRADERQLKNLERVDWEPALRNGNRWYDRLTAALYLTDRTSRDQELARIEQEAIALRNRFNCLGDLAKLLLEKNPSAIGTAMGDILVGLFTPGFRKLQNGYDRADQLRHNLHVAFALEMFRQDHGNYPARLDELAPKYLTAVPGDLFTGKPLVYRPGGNGYLLYSLGVNGQDDGGRGMDDTPPGDDLAVRMPLPPLKAAK